MLLMMTACSQSESGPTVIPPSWKGFTYSVKKADTGKEIERGDINPGDEIRVFAVRNDHGNDFIGKIDGTMYIRYTAYQNTGTPKSETLECPVTSIVKTDFDESLQHSNYALYEDPYATFKLPTIDGEYEFYKVEVGCQFYFKTFGNQYSEVDYSDNSSHEDPYIGNIYTNLNGFHPMNGGSASSKVGGDGLAYQTLYQISYISNEDNT